MCFSLSPLPQCESTDRVGAQAGQAGRHREGKVFLYPHTTAETEYCAGAGNVSSVGVWINFTGDC